MLTPMQRYEWATGPDGWLTPYGWERLAGDLDRVADGYGGGGMHDRYRDRAADCRSRRLRLIVAYQMTLPNNGY